MKKYLCMLVFVLGWLQLSSSLMANETEDKRNFRVISLAPHLTEILYEIGAGQQIVGAVSYSNYPEEAKKIPQIGDYNRLDLETILALKPDLVVGWKSGNSKEEIKRLKKLGLKVHVSDPKELQDVALLMEQLGHLLGREKTAQKRAVKYKEQIESLKTKYQKQTQLKVFYQVWNKPLITINGEHIISHVIEICGGKNIFHDLKGLAPQIGVEAVLQQNPNVIIASGMDESRPEWLDEWKKYPVLDAVQNDNLFHVLPDIIQRNGPRLALGTEAVCQVLHEARSKME